MRGLGKLGARDRNLLVVLIVAVTFYLCYTFVITPQLDKTMLIMGEISAKQSELESAKQLAGQKDILTKQENDLRKELLEKYSAFFVDLNQANLLHRLDTLMVSAGLRMVNYMAVPVAAAPVVLEQGEYIPPDYPMLGLSRSIEPELAKDAVPEQHAAASEEGTGAPDSIPCMEIMVNFDGSTYESVYQFVNLLEQMNKTVIVRNIDYTLTEEGLQGQLVLDFYSIPGFDLSQKDTLEFVNTIPAGKGNPFR